MYVFRLVCEAQGEPAPDVFWTRENRDKIVVTDKKSGRRSTGQCGHLSWSRSVNYRSNYGWYRHFKNWKTVMYNVHCYISSTKIQIHNDMERSKLNNFCSDPLLFSDSGTTAETILSEQGVGWQLRNGPKCMELYIYTDRTILHILAIE